MEVKAKANYETSIKATSTNIAQSRSGISSPKTLYDKQKGKRQEQQHQHHHHDHVIS